MMMLDVMTSLPQDQSKLNFDFVGRSTSATGQGSGSIITPFSMYKGMGGGGGIPREILRGIPGDLLRVLLATHFR